MTTPTAPLSTPSQLQPQNGAVKSAPQTPAPHVPTQAPAQAAEPTVAELQAKLAAASRKEQVNGIEMRKQKALLAEEKKTFGAKLSLAEKAEKAFAAAGITPEDLLYFKANPDPVLKKALGDKYYDRLVEMRINGGAISAEEAAAMVERAKGDVLSDFEKRQEAARAEQQKAAQAKVEQARAELNAQASDFVSKSKAEYPGFEKYPTETVAKAIAQYVEQEWQRTGKALSNKEAADAMEWLDVSGRFVRGEDLSTAAIEKFRPRLEKLTEKLKPATVVPQVDARSAGRTPGSTVERRTLSTDLPATATGQKRTYRTDDERRAAIMALSLQAK